MTSVTERIRLVRKELDALQSADHPAAVAEKHQNYIDGLKREKAMAEQQLAAARACDPDSHEWLGERASPNSLAVARRTWGERADELEQTIATIERELERAQPPLA